MLVIFRWGGGGGACRVHSARCWSLAVLNQAFVCYFLVGGGVGVGGVFLLGMGALQTPPQMNSFYFFLELPQASGTSVLFLPESLYFGGPVDPFTLFFLVLGSLESNQPKKGVPLLSYGYWATNKLYKPVVNLEG